MNKLITIGVTGPESTGKTVLAKALADVLDAKVVDEYARKYLANIDRDYQYDDLLLIAKGQKERQQSARASDAAYVIFDTSLLTIKIWGLDKFGKYPPILDEWMGAENIDLYLLCQPDLPWQPDPLREDRTRRKALFLKYEQQLKKQPTRWTTISGHGEQRLKNARTAIDNFVMSSNR